MERVIDRFDKYRKIKKLSDNQVTNDLNLSIGLLGKSRKNNRDLSKKTIDKILNFYTDINTHWLLSGAGEMLAKEKSEPIKLLPGSNMERILRSANEQAEDPIFDFEVINPEKAVRQLLALVSEKDMELQRWKKKYEELNEKYRDAQDELLEAYRGKRENLPPVGT